MYTFLVHFNYTIFFSNVNTFFKIFSKIFYTQPAIAICDKKRPKKMRLRNIICPGYLTGGILAERQRLVFFLFPSPWAARRESATETTTPATGKISANKKAYRNSPPHHWAI